MAEQSTSQPKKKLGAGSRQWLDSAAAQVPQVAASPQRWVNSKRVPLAAVRIDENNPRRLSISPDDIIELARRYPVEKDQLGPYACDYLESYLKAVKDEHKWTHQQLKDLGSIIEFAFALRSADKLINPIHVYQSETQFKLIAGERRFLAHLLLQEPEIEAKIRPDIPSEHEKALIQWQENANREELPLRDLVWNVGLLLRSYPYQTVDKITAAEAASLINSHRSVAHRYLTVLRCPHPALIQAIDDGRITSLADAAKLAALPVGSMVAALSRASVRSESPKVPSIKIGKAKDYSPVQRLIRAALAGLSDENLDQEISELDLTSVTGINKSLEVILARLSGDNA